MPFTDALPAATTHSDPAPSIHDDRVLILDFGGQYTQLIARRVREAGVYCEILAYDAGERLIEEFS